jgi:hypothetical protein
MDLPRMPVPPSRLVNLMLICRLPFRAPMLERSRRDPDRASRYPKVKTAAGTGPHSAAGSG